MDSSYESVENWSLWFYESDWTSDYAYYAEDPIARNPEGYRDFDGERNIAESDSARGSYVRYLSEGDRLWSHPPPTEQDTSWLTLTRQTSQHGGASTASTLLTVIFPDLSTLTRADPPHPGQKLQRQKPRFEGDMYTALWVRGEGIERAGWCGFCSTWHKLKDSAFNYHMHYTHGISCATGRQVTGPQGIQKGPKSWQILCGACGRWLDVGSDDQAKVRTAYFRHAHKCHASRAVVPEAAHPTF